MGATKEVTKQQTSMTLSKALLSEMRSLVPDGKRSEFIERVIGDALEVHKLYIKAPVANDGPARV